MRYGFRFLTPASSYWDLVMLSEIFEMPVDLEEPLKNLIRHLQNSGTGTSKLQTLAKIGLESDGPDDFLAMAKLAVPDGTWNKIEAYVKAEKSRREEILAAEAQKRAEAKPTDKTEVVLEGFKDNEIQDDGTEGLPPEPKESTSPAQEPIQGFEITPNTPETPKHQENQGKGHKGGRR